MSSPRERSRSSSPKSGANKRKVSTRSRSRSRSRDREQAQEQDGKVKLESGSFKVGQTVKEVSQIVLTRDVGPLKADSVVWFKPSNRPVNNRAKLAGMGIVPAGEENELTEAEAQLPQREVAASLIAQRLIPPMAVPAILAEKDEVEGVVIANAPGSNASDIALDTETLSLPTTPEIERQLVDLQAFDYIIGNTDRHLENYRVESESSRVFAIDNDVAFPTVEVDQLATNVDSSFFGGLPTGITQEFRDNLLLITDEFIDQEILPLIGEPATSRLKERIQSMTKHLETDRPDFEKTIADSYKKLIFR